MDKVKYHRETRYPHNVNMGVTRAQKEALAHEANRQGVSVAAVVRRLIEAHLVAATEAKPRRAADPTGA